MNKKRASIVGKDQIIYGRCKTLAEIINNIKFIYTDGNKNQKAFIETIIGAAIWYIPKPNNFWTGYISIKAIKKFLDKSNKKSTLSEEHETPRKHAAKELLNINRLLTPEYVEKQYINKYCKLHYITLEENKKAIKFQRIFNDPKKVYKEANIELIKINSEQLKQIKQKNEKIINELLEIYTKNYRRTNN